MKKFNPGDLISCYCQVEKLGNGEIIAWPKICSYNGNLLNLHFVKFYFSCFLLFKVTNVISNNGNKDVLSIVSSDTILNSKVGKSNGVDTFILTEDCTIIYSNDIKCNKCNSHCLQQCDLIKNQLKNLKPTIFW